MSQYIFEFLLWSLKLYQFLLLVFVFSSWVGGLPRNKIGFFVIDMVAPLLRFVKKIPHKFGMIDISPIYAILLVGFARSLVETLYLNS